MGHAQLAMRATADLLLVSPTVLRLLCLHVQCPVFKRHNGLLEDVDTLINLSLGNVQWRDKPDRVISGGDDQQSTFPSQCDQGCWIHLELQSQDQSLGANILDQR